MKVQALATFAVVAVFLPIANCALEENATLEDRTCAKRDADAKKVTGTVESCTYHCQPGEGYSNYIEHYYPDGTSCQYNSALTSKCMNKLCHHPDDDIFKKEGKENPENEEEGKKNDNNEDEGEKGGEEENKEEKADENEKKGEEKPDENEEEGEEGHEKEKEDEEDGGGTEDT